MLSGILGRKVGMTQIFGADGIAIPVTVIEAGPCAVTQVRTEAKDGYEAVQLGFGEVKRATRPMLGHLGHALPATPRQRRKQQQEQAKTRQRARQQREAVEGAESGTETEADVAEATGETTAASNQPRASRRRRGTGKALGPFSVLREVDVLDGNVPAVGDIIDVAMFIAGEEVDIIGTSKGKGFAGVMKRHNFRGGPRTHGQSDRSRAPGSVGPGTTPGRVFKGTRMAGRMGNERVTIKDLRVVQADPERNLLVIKGSVPGANGSLVVVRKGAAQMALAARQRA